MAQAAPENLGYVMGHEAEEQHRLDEQAANLRPFTERLLRDAGIAPGMRVLDVGCGTGDVALVAAQMVGRSGVVIGIDRSAEVVATARLRITSRGWEQVRFVVADLATFSTDAPFDAIVGRQVLIHQPEPSAAMRRLAQLLRPGGVIAWSEEVLLPHLAWPPRPLYSQCITWLERTLELAGLQANTGLHLHSVFAQAGLPPPQLRLEGAITAGPDISHHRWLAGTVRTLLPLMERQAVTTAAEVQLDSLEARLIAEATTSGGTACGFALVSALVRLLSP